MSHSPNSYDVVVIGAGSAGLTTAVGLQKTGKRVLLVEQDEMGGECTNAGCIPSKALLHAAKTYYQATNVSGQTEQTNTYRQSALKYVQQTIAKVRAEETPEVIEKLGVKVLKGEAKFLTPCSIEVSGTTYDYKRAVIATGSLPRMIPINGLAPEQTLTNQNLFELSELPERLLIIGSGPIGMEMGQAFAMLGCQVTIATIDEELGRLEDNAIRPLIKKRFEELGIRVLTQANIEKAEGGVAHFTLKSHDAEKTETVEFDKALVAIGRVPNLPDGLEAAKIKYDERCILVDNQFRTSNKYVYAVGDVAQKLKFTHTASDSARQVVKRIVSRGWLRVKRDKAVPKVTYLDPEVAQVGLSYEASLKKYSEEELVRIEVPFSHNDRAKTDGAADGLLVVIARRLSGTVLGAHIVGPRAGEIINIFTLTIDEKISLWRLQRLIFAYPTYSLVVQKAGDHFVAHQLSNLKRDLLRLFIHHLPKLAAALIWIVLLSLLYRYQSAHDMDATETALMLFDFITMTVWGPLVYILFYAIRPVTFFPATALTILAGVFFGLVYGTLLTILAATLSAAVAYGVGRFFGRGWHLEDSPLGKWVIALRENTFEAILTMRLIFLPYDGVSYLAGILKTSFLPFILATFFGIILGTTTFVSIGASLDIEEFKMDGLSFNALEPQFLGLSVLIFVGSIILSRVLRRWKAKEA